MLTIRIPDELRDQLDAARGQTPRERFARQMIELGLEESQGVGVTRKSPPTRAKESSKPPESFELPKIAPRHWGR